METANTTIPAAVESLRETYDAPRITLRLLLMRIGRSIVNRRIGWPGAIAIGFLLVTLLVVGGYFLGYPLHGAAGPD